MPRQRLEFADCPACGRKVSVAVREDDYAWLIGDHYESSCEHCGVGLAWRFKDVGDWAAWAPISRECRVRIKPTPRPDPGPAP